MNKIGKPVEEWTNIDIESNNNSFTKILDEYNQERNKILLGGGAIAIEKHHSRHKMTAYERVKYLLDNDAEVLDIGQFCAYEMYREYGEINSGENNANFGGVHQTPEVRKDMSEKKKGSKNNQWGKHWYTNGVEEKCVYEVDKPDGWYRGRNY